MFKNVVFGLSVVAGMLFGGSVVSADQYVVKSGDTVTSIAMNNGVTVDDIVLLNSIEDANVIFAGEVLEVESVQTAVVNTTAKRNETVQVSDPDSAVAPVQNETVVPVQEVQPAQVETPQQDTPAIAASDIVTADGVDDKGIKFDDNNNSNDQYYIDDVNNWGYGHTEDNSDKNVTTPVLTVPAPDQFVTPQHTTFNSTEAQPIAGDTSLDGSKVFNGSDWVLK